MLTSSRHVPSFCTEPTQHGRFLVQERMMTSDNSNNSVDDLNMRDQGSKNIAFSNNSSSYNSHTRHGSFGGPAANNTSQDHLKVSPLLSKSRDKMDSSKHNSIDNPS